MNDHAVMVISGYNIRAVITFCRWAAAHDVNYHIIAKCKEDPIFYTDYKEHVAFTRDSPSLGPEQFRLWCEALCRQYGYKRIIIIFCIHFFSPYLLF